MPSNWLTLAFTLLKMPVLKAEEYAFKDENMKKCIRMGIIVLKIFICGGGDRDVTHRFYACKLHLEVACLFLWSQIAFYGSADVLL